MKEYKYPFWYRAINSMPLIFFVLGLLFCVDWLLMYFGINNDSFLGGTTNNYDLYLQSGLGMIFLSLFILIRINEFRIENDGIKVSLFYLFWIFIQWEDVLKLKPMRHIGNWNPNMPWILKVKKLTIFHRLASISFFAGFDPIIIISPQLIDFDGFINTIESKLKSMPNPRSTRQPSTCEVL